ncbi:MAG: AMP-binding protein, partial [Rhodocyclaceae bacterium]
MTEKMLWQPSAQRIAAAQLTAFARWACRSASADYDAVHRWSIEHPADFWSALWDFAEVRGEKGQRILVDGDEMPGAQWFPEARLNYAENLLRRRDGTTALIFRGEDKLARRITHAELYLRIAQLAAAMKAEGIGIGDVVAAYMPNLPETLIAFLAAASIGAIFTSASPDFGVQGVLDRFGQVDPKLLFVVDGYFYNGKEIDTLGKVRAIAARLPSLRK